MTSETLALPSAGPIVILAMIAVRLPRCVTTGSGTRVELESEFFNNVGDVPSSVTLKPEMDLNSSTTSTWTIIYCTLFLGGYFD